jgi:hypothetical protein
LKNHRAETRREIRGFPCDSSKILGEKPGPFLLTLGKVGSSASTRNSRGETAVGWLTTQSVSDRSAGQIPCEQGILQGILPIRGQFRHLQHQITQKFQCLTVQIPCASEQGIFLTEQGILVVAAGKIGKSLLHSRENLKI